MWPLSDYPICLLAICMVSCSVSVSAGCTVPRQFSVGSQIAGYSAPASALLPISRESFVAILL